jgi:hypothetical protein
LGRGGLGGLGNLWRLLLRGGIDGRRRRTRGVNAVVIGVAVRDAGSGWTLTLGAGCARLRRGHG